MLRTILAFALMLLTLLSCAPVPGAHASEESGFVFVSHDADDSTDDTAETGSIIFSSNVGTDAPTAPAPQAASPMPMLVNESYPVSDSFVPSDLVMMTDYCDPDVVRIKGSKIEGERVAVDALMTMFRAAIDEGVRNWQISSGYRSVQYQQEMWDNQVYKYRKEGKSGSDARAATARYMARPGASEHHSGLAFDVTVPGEDSFVSTKQYKWLAENCWDYGFIIRYTAEKQPITGINAEPWHVRYVGLPHSQIMRDSGQCLEEYLGAV